jgi:hypothetical protein
VINYINANPGIYVYCDQETPHYIADPTGWNIQLDLEFSTTALIGLCDPNRGASSSSSSSSNSASDGMLLVQGGPPPPPMDDDHFPPPPMDDSLPGGGDDDEYVGDCPCSDVSFCFAS